MKTKCGSKLGVSFAGIFYECEYCKKMLNCATECKRVKFLQNVLVNPIFNRMKIIVLVFDITQQHE
jgi:hypothetical protein